MRIRVQTLRPRRILCAIVSTSLLVTASAASAEAQGTSFTANRVTLTMWNDVTQNEALNGAKTYWLTDAISLFEKANPGIRVDLLRTPEASTQAFNALLRTSEVSRTTPDIAEFYSGGDILQNQNYLLPLNKYISPEFMSSLNPAWWRFARDSFGTQGAIYGVPYGDGAEYLVYYNRALIRKAGVNLGAGSFPHNWTDLIALGKKIKAAGITPFEFGEKEGYFGAWTQDAVISSEVGTAGVVNMYNGTLSMDSAPMIKSYEAWHALYADGVTNADALSLDSNQGIAQFAAGKAAMTVTGAFEDTSILPELGRNNVGVFPVPGLPGAPFPKVLSGGNGNAYSIFANTKHPVQAMELVKFLVSEKVQLIALDGGFGELPSNVGFRLSSAELAKIADIDPVIKQTYEFIATNGYSVAEAWDNIMPASVASYWYQTNSGVFGGSLSAQAAAQSLEGQMKLYLSSQK